MTPRRGGTTSLRRAPSESTEITYSPVCAIARSPAAAGIATNPYARYASAVSGAGEAPAQNRGWRGALLGTVAAGALAVVASPSDAGPDLCTVGGSTATCQGNQSAGIASGADFDPTAIATLNVNSLTANIAPAAGVDGISFERTGAGNTITITSNTGAFAINATGAGADGIYARGDDAVTINHTGDITSAAARGIYAYSSNGPVTITSAGNFTSAGHAIEAQNCGCSGGITINHTGDLTSTAGSGIYAYSTSGTVAVTSKGTIAAAAAGIDARGFGNVTVQHTGNIVSTASSGIYAYSGNGTVNVTTVGNITAFCCGINAIGMGDVTVSHTGDITAQSSFGIYGVSLNGNVNVTVNGGRINGGFAGIGIIGFNTNTVTVGPSATVTGGTWAILAAGGANTVNNFGIVTGSVNLGGGVNVFNNMAGGLFNAGVTVNLGAGALNNSGTVAPGGIGTIQTTTLTGNFAQNAGGRFAVDVNLAAGTSDVLVVSGTATVAGYVVPNVFNTGALPQTFTIVSAAGGVTNNGLTIHNTAVVTVDGQLLYPNPNEVQLQINSITVNFAPSGLTPNQHATAQHLNGAFLTGSGNLTSLLNYLSGLDFAAFAAALDHLHPEPYLASVQTMLWSGFNFGNSLMSCPAPSESGLVLAKEGGCLWLRAEGHTTALRASPGFIGFDESAGGFSAGLQRALTQHWFVSAAIGYERSEIDVDTRARVHGNVFHGGAALKYIDGNFLAAASVNGAFARYDTTRFNIPTAGTASADADMGLFNARMRFAYTIGSPVFQVKPLIDFEVTGLFRSAINESGAGALNLQVQSKTDWVFTAAPALEFAGEWREGERHWRPYLRLGVRVLSKNSLSATALFQGSPAGTSPFTVTTPLDRALGEVSAGVDVWQAGRYSLRLGYDGRFGEHTRQHGGQLKLRAAF